MNKKTLLQFIGFLSLSYLVTAASAPVDICVSPLLTTEWGQTTVNGNACFNYFTPDSTGYPPAAAGSATNHPAGCVATAMAQVMNYHQWALPQYPFGTKFTLWANGYSYQGSLMGGTLGHYNWSIMPDLAANPAARQEAGRLLHDLGLALSMQYWSWAAGGSGTDFDYIDNVFNGFTYSNAVTIEGNYVSGGVLQPQSISTALAQLALTTNLDAGLPVIIGINDQALQSGHALVIDGYGYDSSGTIWFHYNFGLPVHGVTPPATNLGWFTIPGVGTTNDSAGYSILDGIAFNLFKAVPIPATGEIISGRITDKSGLPLPGIHVQITSPAPGFPPVTVFTNAQGIYASYGTIAPNRQYMVSVSGPGYVSSSQVCNVGISAKQWVNTPPPGDGYYINTVGNARADFSLAQSIDLPPSPPISDMSTLAGLSRYWNTTHTLLTDPAIGYDYNGDWSVDMQDLFRLIHAWLALPPEFRTAFNIHFDTVGTLPANLPWQYAGSGGPWSVAGAPLFAAQSPAIADGQSTSCKLPVKVLPGSPGTLDIMFHLECDTEMNADVFEFLVDGVVQTSMAGFSAFSGPLPNQPVHYHLQGLNTPQQIILEWRYTKDAANSAGADTVWFSSVNINAQP